ncbi:MAG: branched-chain amino acid aminotransferase [Planctomyces sp.]|nr:branched-chain amino acid aminotransferase [Planctomyces sp.]
MTNLATQLLNDEAGFIVSAELVLVATITVLGLIVGLSELALNINNELEDVGSAFASVQQSFSFQGACGHKGSKSGSCFTDKPNYCDGQYDIH